MPNIYFQIAPSIYLSTSQLQLLVVSQVKGSTSHLPSLPCLPLPPWLKQDLQLVQVAITTGSPACCQKWKLFKSMELVVATPKY